MDEDTSSIGRVIGNYRIVAKVGEGGFGYVYRAEHIFQQFEDRVVAIKIARTKQNSPEVHADFLQEARMLLDLKHRYILPFIDIGPNKDDLYLMTEYAAHGSLRERIPLPPILLPTQEVCNILSQIGQALHYIHQRNIIHRDLKPANILFNAQDEALLADFGIAMMASAAGIKQEKVAGTPHYMAPEQFHGEGSRQSDQYAFAIITYELFTGQRPFNASRIWEWHHQHATKQPADPREFNHDIPEYRALAILKALAKEPADRHVDINAFLAALKVQYTQETIVIIPPAHVSQKDKGELFDKAEAFLQAGHLEEALVSYNQLIKLDPESARAYCGKGNVFIKQRGRKLDALAAYTHANTLDPNFLPAHMGVGNACYSLGYYQEAIEAYQKTAKITLDAVLSLKIAFACEKCGRNDDALAAYETAIRYGADPIKTRKRKIELLKSLQHYPEEVIKEYDCIIQIASDPIPVCHEKKEYLLSVERYDETFAVCEQIIKLNPDIIEAYYELANLQEQHGASDDKLLASYQRVIERVPDDIVTRYKMVDVLERLERYEDALEICTQIITLVPDDVKARYRKLCFLKQFEWHELIIRECEEISKRDPHVAVVYYDKAQAYEALGNAEEEKKDDDTGQILKKLAMRILGIRHNPSHYYKKALDAYDAASRTASDNSLYCSTSKGDLLEHLGKYKRAGKERLDAGRHRATQMDQSRVVFWIFFGVPFLINTVLIGVLLLAFYQPLEVCGGMVIIAFFISAVCAYFIYKKDQPYHLYHPALLFIPICSFAFEWYCVGLLVPGSGLLIALTFCLFSFFGNTFMYFKIDAYEEQVVFYIIRLVVKFIVLFFCLILLCLTGLRAGFVTVGGTLAKGYRKSQVRRQNDRAAQKAQSRKKRVKCLDCRGKGTIRCPICRGKGYKIAWKLIHKPGEAYYSKRDCSGCQGEGRFICSSCKGLKKLQNFPF